MKTVSIAAAFLGLLVYVAATIYLAMTFLSGFMATASPRLVIVILLVTLGFVVNIVLLRKAVSLEDIPSKKLLTLSVIFSLLVLVPVFVAAFDLMPY